MFNHDMQSFLDYFQSNYQVLMFIAHFIFAVLSGYV